MKPTLLSSAKPLRLSSDQPDPSHFVTSIASPHVNIHHTLRKSTDSRDPKSAFNYPDTHTKKHQASNLKDLLSPVDHKLIEIPKKGLTTKYDSEKNKMLQKDHPRKPSEHNGVNPLSEVQLKEYLNKRLSFDSSNEPTHKTGSHLKPKYSNPEVTPSNYVQRHAETHAKDAQYASNPVHSHTGDSSKAGTTRGVIYSNAYNTPMNSKGVIVRKDSNAYEGSGKCKTAGS